MSKYVLQKRDSLNKSWNDVSLFGNILEENSVSKLVQRIINDELNPDGFKCIRIIEVDFVRSEKEI